MCLCVLIGLTLTSADCIIITNGQAVNAYEQQQWPTASRLECILCGISFENTVAEHQLRGMSDCGLALVIR